MKRKIIAICLITVFLLTGCLDKIIIGIEEDPLGSLVIQGKLIRGTPSKVSVIVTETFFLKNFFTPKKIRNATVSLYNQADQKLDVPMVDPGIYERSIPVGHPNFTVEAGQSYHLEVIAGDGRHFESGMEALNPVPKVLDLKAVKFVREVEVEEFIRFEDNFNYFVDTELGTDGSTQNARLRWEATCTYRLNDLPNIPVFGEVPEAKTCYITENLNFNNVAVFDGRIIEGNALIDHSVIELRVDYKYAQGHYFTLVQESLSQGAFEYWTQIRQVIERTGNMFEPPVGKIQSNFKNINDPSEDVFGYFYATEQDTIRLFIDPAFAGSPTPFCPRPPTPSASPFGPPPYGVQVCNDCTILDNSTLIKPSFWDR